MTARDNGHWILKLMTERALDLWDYCVIYVLKSLTFLLQIANFVFQLPQLFLFLHVVAKVVLELSNFLGQFLNFNFLFAVLLVCLV